MAYFPKKSKEQKPRICVECKKEFTPQHHGGTKQFCSYRCANIHKWKSRTRPQKKVVTKICVECGKEYVKLAKYSIVQWKVNKFCSSKCAAAGKKINDGMSNGERNRRKNGRPKIGTPEWLEKLKATTKEGMLKPEVIEKLQRPKGPMKEGQKMLISEALAGIIPKNLGIGYPGGNGPYANVQRGEYECSKGSVYFRSKWEANYALYLDFLIKQGEIDSWEFEPEVFFFDKIKLGTRSYRPDFKILNPDGSVEYHEVKGHMNDKSLTKLKRMGIYFPEVTVILIDKDFYKSIIKKLTGVIKFYK